MTDVIVARPVVDLADRFWQWFLARNPVFATVLGDERYDDRLPDPGPDAREEEIAAIISTLKATLPRGDQRARTSSDGETRGDNPSRVAEGRRAEGRLSLWPESPRGIRVAPTAPPVKDDDTEELTARVLARLSQLTLGELVQRLSVEDAKSGGKERKAGKA